LILLLVILHERAGIVDQPDLLVRGDHVVLAERDAGLERVPEAEAHDRVGEQDGLLLAGVAVDDIDDVRDLLLGEEAVDGLERHLVALRERLAEQHPPRPRAPDGPRSCRRSSYSRRARPRAPATDNRGPGPCPARAR